VAHSGTPQHVAAVLQRTYGFTCADVKCLCQQAAVRAMARRAPVVTPEDVSAALDEFRASVTHAMVERHREWRQKISRAAVQ
jgi:ATP-dependent 26S proteasome regulatory subunit